MSTNGDEETVGCPSCESITGASFKFCSQCGESLQEKKMSEEKENEEVEPDEAEDYEEIEDKGLESCELARKNAKRLDEHDEELGSFEKLIEEHDAELREVGEGIDKLIEFHDSDSETETSGNGNGEDEPPKPSKNGGNDSGDDTSHPKKPETGNGSGLNGGGNWSGGNGGSNGGSSGTGDDSNLPMIGLLICLLILAILAFFAGRNFQQDNQGADQTVKVEPVEESLEEEVWERVPDEIESRLEKAKFNNLVDLVKETDSRALAFERCESEQFRDQIATCENFVGLSYYVGEEDEVEIRDRLYDLRRHMDTDS